MNKIFNCLFLGLLLFAVSCDKKGLSLYNEGGEGFVPEEGASLGVDIDWRHVKELPQKATVIVYDQSESLSNTTQVDSITHAEVFLHKGYNSVAVMNDDVNSLNTIEVRDLDNYVNAQVFTLPVPKNSWYMEYAGGELVTMQPEKFMFDKKDSVYVDRAMIDSAKVGRDVTVTTLYPKDCVKKVCVKVAIKNIYRLLSARAAVVGLAGGYGFYTNKPTSKTVTHLIGSKDWRLVPDAENPMNGYIEANFKTFGCPGKDDFSKGDYLLDLFLNLSDNDQWVEITIDDIEGQIKPDGDDWVIDLTDKDYVDLETIDVPGEGGNPGEGEGEGDGDKGGNGSINVEIDGWENAENSVI